jgi:hypothetical protein
MPLVIVAAADVVSVCLAVLVLRRRQPPRGRQHLAASLPVWREPAPRVDPDFKHRPWTDRDVAFAQMEFGQRSQDGIPSIAFIAPQWSMN